VVIDRANHSNSRNAAAVQAGDSRAQGESRNYEMDFASAVKGVMTESVCQFNLRKFLAPAVRNSNLKKGLTPCSNAIDSLAFSQGWRSLRRFAPSRPALI